MPYIMCFAIGIILGALLMNLEVKDLTRINSKLKRTINNLEDDIGTKLEARDNFYIKELEKRERLVRGYRNLSFQYEKLIKKCCDKEVDYENNLKLFRHNLTKQNKELVDKLNPEN